MKKFVVSVSLLVLGVLGWHFGVAPLLRHAPADESNVTPTIDELRVMSREDRLAIRNVVLPMFANMPDTTVNEALPSSVSGTSSASVAGSVGVSDPYEVYAAGAFVGVDTSRHGSGHAIVYVLPEGDHLLRIEAFSVTNGPELRVLLSEVPAPRDEVELSQGATVDLGLLKGNRGSQNYGIGGAAPLENMRSVVIYSPLFETVYAVATLHNEVIGK